MGRRGGHTWPDLNNSFSFSSPAILLPLMPNPTSRSTDLFMQLRHCTRTNRVRPRRQKGAAVHCEDRCVSINLKSARPETVNDVQFWEENNWQCRAKKFLRSSEVFFQGTQKGIYLCDAAQRKHFHHICRSRRATKASIDTARWESRASVTKRSFENKN